MRRDKNENFIQNVGEPFFVHMTSKEQINVLKLNSNYESTIYIDATGTIVKTPKSSKTKALFYAAVIKIDQMICPVTTMISCRHTTLAISDWLTEFKFFCMENKIWPPCKQVVTDVSYATINAILLSWNLLGSAQSNKMDALLQYLHICYKSVCTEKAPDITVLKFCCNHYMKLMCDQINEKFKQSKKTRKFLKETLACAYNFDNIKVVYYWYYNLCIILNSKFMVDDVKNSFEILMNLNFKSSAKIQDIILETTEKPNPEKSVSNIESWSTYKAIELVSCKRSLQINDFIALSFLSCF